MELRLLKGAPLTCGGWPPVQPTFEPDPDKTQQEDDYEKGYMYEAGKAEFVPVHGPCEYKGGFNVKHDEEDGNQVERDREGKACRAGGNDSAFVGHSLGWRVGLCPEPPGRDMDKADEKYGCRCVKYKRQVLTGEGLIHGDCLGCFDVHADLSH